MFEGIPWTKLPTQSVHELRAACAFAQHGAVSATAQARTGSRLPAALLPAGFLLYPAVSAISILVNCRCSLSYTSYVPTASLSNFEPAASTFLIKLLEKYSRLSCTLGFFYYPKVPNVQYLLGFVQYLNLLLQSGFWWSQSRKIMFYSLTS